LNVDFRLFRFAVSQHVVVESGAMHSNVMFSTPPSFSVPLRSVFAEDARLPLAGTRFLRAQARILKRTK